MSQHGMSHSESTIHCTVSPCCLHTSVWCFSLKNNTPRVCLFVTEKKPSTSAVLFFHGRRMYLSALCHSVTEEVCGNVWWVIGAEDKYASEWYWYAILWPKKSTGMPQNGIGMPFCNRRRVHFSVCYFLSEEKHQCTWVCDGRRIHLCVHYSDWRIHLSAYYSLKKKRIHLSVTSFWHATCDLRENTPQTVRSLCIWFRGRGMIFNKSLYCCLEIIGI